MVDFRPLLFLNALALMLLVTAGFASIRNDQPSGEVVEAAAPTIENTAQTSTAVVKAVSVPPAESEAVYEPPKVNTEPFLIPELAEAPPAIASAELPKTLNTHAADTAESSSEPVPAPKTGTLTLRSNVADDQVEINGKAYGATRLDLELAPGKYDITITKNGFQPWQQSVVLNAGKELTLVGKLEAYTSVDHQNGVWRGNVKTGDGTYIDSDNLRYEGHFVDGAFHGTGTAWYADGSRYEGDWENGRRSGEGVWRDADGSRYTGQFSADAFHGQGTLTLENGDILTGEWSQNQLNGHGSLTTADGMLYVGSFRNSDFHGRGTLTYPDGRHYEGDFSNGSFHGDGSEVFANGKKYEGEYIEGKFHGNGLLRNPNGSSIEATFRHGEPYGQVRLTTAAGEIFTARTTEPGVCYRDKSYRATQCPTLEGW
ncbi:PEGA domain-containing protein [Marinobacter sp. 2_MG-2023]|uniref:PEGA domain-containing protein n=1 Tax=Marinobacter sp. 2_MG-2023 TaxID=3062679 RepID=UPI0026E354F1|nr:PEGA domain-containing protein [Marinobacter sp. 2_MG-2023]MDO6440708.1 PEGA domain-containing protein [Marinobacter sp. 2_MG-2023]